MKLRLTLLGWLLSTSLATAQQPMMGSVEGGITNVLRSSTPATVGTNVNFGAVNDLNQGVWPVSGVIDKLYVFMGTAPGAGTSRTFSLRKNGATQLVACTIADADTTCNNTSDTFSVTAGDNVIMLTSFSGAPAVSASVGWGFQFTPTTPDETVVQSSWLFNGPGFGQIPDSRLISPQATEPLVLMPTAAGAISALYVSSNAGPGVSEDYVITARKNSADTAVTCTITGSGTGAGVNRCNDTANSASMAEGDSVSIRLSSVNGTPPAMASAVGIRFVPTVANNFYFSGGGRSSDASSVRYLTVSGRRAPTANEIESVQLASMTFYLTKMRVTTTDPATGSRVFTLRVNGVDSGLTCTIAAGSTSCVITSTVNVVAGDQLAISDTPVGVAVQGSPRVLLLAQSTSPVVALGQFFMMGGL